MQKSIHRNKQLNKLPCFRAFELSSYFKRERGAAAIITTLSVMVASMMILSFFSLSLISAQKISFAKIKSLSSNFAAEAGLEDNLYRIKTQKNYTASNTLPVGQGQSNVTITTNGNIKTILSEGVTNSTIKRIRAIATLTASEVSFHYGVQVGAGGLEMEQNSQINGNVYSNGPVEGESGSKIAGDAYVATAMALDSQWTTQNAQTIFGEQSANPNVFDVAQSFTPSATGTLAQIDFYLKKNSNPGDITVRILSDNGSGSPSKTTLASSTIEASKVTTSYGFVDAIFSTLPTLNAGTNYWVMLDTSDSSNKYWYWGKDSALGNTNGVSKYSIDWNAGTPVWTTDSGDFNFKTWFGTGVNSIDGMIVTGDAKANTIIDSNICGDAYYQNIDSSSLNFLNSPTSPICSAPLTGGTGYPGSPDQPVQSMPISDANIAEWKSDAQVGEPIAGDYSIANNVSLGPKEITGNLLMTSNNKILTITGTIYVHGYIDVTNGSTIQCDPSYGSNSCIVIADQWIHTENNSAFRGSGESSSFLLMLSNSNCDGTFSEGCTHHNAGVDIHNNATGVIFYAPNGMINLHNGVNVTEVTAYKLRIDNTAVITYEQGLANANFSSGPGASWQITDWKEVE